VDIQLAQPCTQARDASGIGDPIHRLGVHRPTYSSPALSRSAVDQGRNAGSSGGVNAALAGAPTARDQAEGLWRLHGPSNKLAHRVHFLLFRCEAECANYSLLYKAGNDADKEICLE
jgi:hypothetical protein